MSMFMIKMVDGTERPLKDFDFECEAKDDAGRHFSGYAESVFDLREDMEVAPEFRKMWSAGSYWDGDWGTEFDNYTEFNEIQPPVRYQSVLDLTLSGTDLAATGLDVDAFRGKMYRITVSEILS